jgi:hypothetical protein
VLTTTLRGVVVQVCELARRHGDPTFKAMWHDATFKRGRHTLRQSADDIAERRAVMQRWRDAHACVLRRPRRGTHVPPFIGLLGDVGDPACGVPRVHLVFHAVHSSDVAYKVFLQGFASLEKEDPGYFGRGVYFSHDLEVMLSCRGRLLASSSLSLSLLLLLLL